MQTESRIHHHIKEQLFTIARDHPDAEVTVVIVDKKSRHTMVETTGESATVVLSIVALYKMLIATGVHSIASISNMIRMALQKTDDVNK